MYKIGTKFRASRHDGNNEYEIISDDGLTYKVKWKCVDGKYNTWSQNKTNLFQEINNGNWKITFIPKQKCTLCIR